MGTARNCSGGGSGAIDNAVRNESDDEASITEGDSGDDASSVTATRLRRASPILRAEAAVAAVAAVAATP